MNGWKRKTAAALLLAALFATMLTGCKTEQTPAAPEPSPAPAAPASQQMPASPASTEPPMVPNPEVEQKYRETMDVLARVLDNNCNLLYNGFSEEDEYPYVTSGVMEVSMYEKRAELLRNIGYAFEDISGDGMPELLIGSIPDSASEVPEKQVIYGGFTCKDGEPVCFLDGWARNFYQWMGDGRFYNFGSGGAAYSGFGTFRISEDGTALACEDWYFSDTKGADASEIVYYHNTTGVWDKNAAQEISMTSDAFWELSDSLDESCKEMRLLPFAKYEYTGRVNQPLECKVYADYYDDAAYKYTKIEDASQYMKNVDPAYEVKVLFQTDEDVKDFRLLALSLKDVDANGHASFDVTELFCVPLVRPDAPLMVPMNFPGDMPSNGFSYTDTDGKTKTYTISMSGFDGALVTAPID